MIHPYMKAYLSEKIACRCGSVCRGIMALLVVVCSCLCMGGDLAEDWKTGDLWKQKKGRISSHGWTFGDIQLGEVVRDWKDEQEDAQPAAEAENDSGDLLRVTCMIYNKGDDGDIDKKTFDDKFNACVESLNAFIGKKGRNVQIPKSKTAVKVKAMQWRGENGVLRLECAVTGSKKGQTMEFIRLILAPDVATLEKGGVSDKVGLRDLRANVTKDDDGTIWIQNVPMVDQGGKGYCVPATVARVFAYYGMDKVDMHSLAAACGSDADSGTSLGKMRESLETLGRTFRVRIKSVSQPAGSHFDFIKDYNREAKRVGKSELPMVSSNAMHASGWFSNIDQELWLAVRAKKSSDVKKWMAPIRRHIDSGVPVLWSVFASGMYNREGREGGGAGGGHMRMIIGYNPVENTIIYSDSWGNWAAKRVMTMAEAYSVTDATYVLQP